MKKIYEWIKAKLNIRSVRRRSEDVLKVYSNLESKEYLRIDVNGHITWNMYTPYEKVIKIKDKEMLGIALIGLLNQMTNSKYDMSLIDKDLYEKYLKFLESKK